MVLCKSNMALSLILYSEYVLTSSFHGLAFAILFEKQFFVHSDKNSERMLTLLRTINLEDCFLFSESNYLQNEKFMPQYRIVKQIILKNMKRTNLFLMSNL